MGETASVSDYEALIAAKKKEVDALTKSIEQKMERVGELGVEIATLKDDAGDSAESLEEDKKFAGDMKKKSGADKKSATKDLMGTEKYISSLHGECDWLLKYHEVRKEARADEIDALGKAKAVLNGADYS